MALFAISCTHEIQQAEPLNPVDPTYTSNFGTQLECEQVSDSAMLIATAMAYYHDALIADGIDSFLVRHNRLSSFYWALTPNSLVLVDTVIARYSRTFLIDEQIVEDFFLALHSHGNVLLKTGGQPN